MRILGIETSCDETSASVLENGVRVLSCIIASSRKDFEKVGGVIPEEAARRQQETILPVIHETMTKASAKPEDIDAIAVTCGPGLLGSLLVGTTTARVLAAIWKKPLIGVHHTLGHLSSTFLKDLTQAPAPDPVFPILTLSVSGGHTDLWYRTAHTKGKLIGRTLDDAAGEAFDKGAVMLGLPYPGGPALAKLAENGDRAAHAFPNPLHEQDTLDFSLSGLKTALKYLLRDLDSDRGRNARSDEDIAASFQEAICRHLCSRLSKAVERFPDLKEIHIVGGVSANVRLREVVKEISKKHGITVRFPATLRFCTDNAAMIAAAGYAMLTENPEEAVRPFTTNATMRLDLA